ncbi:MAG: methionyl-tRNA formyltransferase [Anaerolineae bacterium]
MTERARVVFMGTPEYAVPILLGLLAAHQVLAVVTQPDRPAGRGRALKPSPVKEAALAHGLEVLQPTRLRDNPPFLEKVRDLNPDVLVVAAFGMILPSEVLTLPPHGCLNVHASLLPRHRGAAPVPAAILAGDPETGVTIICMDEGVDTGPILSQARCAIAEEDTAGILTGKLAILGRDLLLETLPRWLMGEIVPSPQDGKAATYTGHLEKSIAEIDWTKPAEQLAREVRAYNPWPGSFTFWRGQRLKVLRAQALRSPSAHGVPGQVVINGDDPGVITGCGILILKEVQLAGKQALAAVDFCRGQQGFMGAVLGQ